MDGIINTVPDSLHAGISDACGEDFADSYLWGARLSNGRLMPHTLTAFHRLSQSHNAMKALASLNIGLDRPEPFPGRPARMSITEAYPDYFPSFKPRKRAA